MTLTLYLAWLDLATAADTALTSVHFWGAALVAFVLATVVRTVADSVRARVRTLSTLCLLDSTITALTCTDMRPDTVADTCPDRPGHVTDGGC